MTTSTATPRRRAVGPIEFFLTEDHVRLDRMLCAVEQPDGTIDDVAYSHFREGLLRHIGMEEKVLLPFARRKQKGYPLAIAAALRRDHGVIAKLLVRSPSRALITTLMERLATHNLLEEGPNGLYASCDSLISNEQEAADVLATLKAQPIVPLAKYYDGPMHIIAHNKL